jgi:hypothetical protein
MENGQGIGQAAHFSLFIVWFHPNGKKFINFYNEI